MKRVIKAATRLTLLAIAISLTAIITQAQSGWTSKRIGSGGKDLNAVYFTDAKHGWVGGDDGFLSHTEDGGASWAERSIGTDRSINDVYFVSKDAGFVLAGGSIFRTDDGGQTWREAHKFSASEFADAAPELYSLRFNGKKRGWVVGSVSRGDTIVGSILAITRDGGASWEILHAPSQAELIHIDFVDEKHGWIVGADGTILRTEDAGDSWAKQESGTKATLYHVDFRNEKQGWAVGERGTIVRTTDGGQSWSLMESPARATLLSVQFVGDGDGWIIGRGGVILRSGDGGRTWVEQESTTKENLFALFMNKKNGWAVGADGLVLRYER
ncbi:MAG TPA: YCF48-related protein [Pyrinomonadaceae bacterium]|nr:YCF48-related protein [Pyrinomonadaceae bacterium]